MNTKKILLSPATILLIATTIVGLSITIYGHIEIGLQVMILPSWLALTILSSSYAINANWKQIITVCLGLAAFLFVAYMVPLKTNHIGFWVLESLVIFGMDGLVYTFRKRKVKNASTEK